MAKLRISVGRKIGRPGFGSVGADIGLEYDLDDSLLATESEFDAEACRLAAILRRALSDELRRLVDDDKAEAPAQSNGRDYEDQPSQARSPSRREPDRERDPAPSDRSPSRGSGESGRRGGSRRSGAALFTQCMQLKERGFGDPMRRVDAWAKKLRLPQKWKDWNEEDVEEAYAVADIRD